MSEEALPKAKQLFRFLKAFAERRMPVRRQLSEQLWSMRLFDLPRYPTVQIGEVWNVRSRRARR